MKIVPEVAFEGTELKYPREEVEVTEASSMRSQPSLSPSDGRFCSDSQSIVSRVVMKSSRFLGIITILGLVVGCAEDQQSRTVPLTEQEHEAPAPDGAATTAPRAIATH